MRFIDPLKIITACLVAMGVLMIAISAISAADLIGAL